MRIHTIWNRAETPLAFDEDPYSSTIPFVGLPNAAKIRWTAFQAKSQGVDVHIGGHGGDEIFDTDENALFHILHRHPIRAWKAIQRYRRLYRWSNKDIWEAFLVDDSPLDLFDRMSEKVCEEPETLTYMPNRWMIGSWYAPPWINLNLMREAQTEMRIRFIKYGFPTSWNEKLYRTVSDSAASTRHIRWIYGQEGVRLRTPFLEESIFRCMCRIEPSLIINPDQPKRALTEAMKGVVNPNIYRRITKDVTLPDIFKGWERNKKRLTQDVQNWSLVNHGLVNKVILEDAIMRRKITRIEPIALWRTLATESSLAAHEN